MSSEIYIAYEFPDPWASRMIDTDTDLVRLVCRLQDKNQVVSAYGPVIYKCEADQDPMYHGVPVCLWCGGDVVCPVGQDGQENGLMSSVAHFVLGLEDHDE